LATIQAMGGIMNVSLLVPPDILEQLVLNVPALE
jgi:hypothetical protein